ncbi:hypothetical protein B0J14DRAFT_639253 [Halenospora varia]|nr:hypothetical protein B0J14DRAFT_639253 [Halenospora varia]
MGNCISSIHKKYTVQADPLLKLEAEHSRGLDVATKAILEADFGFGDYKALQNATKKYTGTTMAFTVLSNKQKNAHLVALVRRVCEERGWVAGWKCLAEAAPNCGLHKEFMKDISICAETYGGIRVTETRPKTIDVRIKIAAHPNTDSLFEIGPKGLGGKAWKADQEYANIIDRWTIPGFKQMGPCTLFGWNGVNKKTVAPADEEACRAMQMLGTVDYDTDLDVENNKGFMQALDEASRKVTVHGKPIQGGSLAALLNLDLQTHIRSVQMKWVEQAADSFVLGPTDVTPEDWVITSALDCTVIMGFAYQSPKGYLLSRKSVYVGTLMGNLHDLLFDRGCSSRISAVPYVFGAGVARHDVHCATTALAIGCLDTTAQRVADLTGDNLPLFGDSLEIQAVAWSAFNGRYRAWERFVKYTRQLKNSETVEAKLILKAANQCLVKVDDIKDTDITAAWTETMKAGSDVRLVERKAASYPPGPGSEILNTPGVQKPDICEACTVLFEKAINNPKDEIRGAPGLPENISTMQAVCLAAAIRRGAVWATTAECCDVCACRIGVWSDNVSYRVLVTLMASEQELDPKEWLLQTYLTGCVEFWPISVPSILAGFDLVGDLTYEVGAMGGRDVVNC